MFLGLQKNKNFYGLNNLSMLSLKQRKKFLVTERIACRKRYLVTVMMLQLTQRERNGRKMRQNEKCWGVTLAVRWLLRVWMHSIKNEIHSFTYCNSFLEDFYSGKCTSDQTIFHTLWSDYYYICLNLSIGYFIALK